MKKFSTLLTIAILIAGGIYFFVLSKTSVLYNFECIAPLYSDTSILKVCLMPVPPKRNSFVRYVYVYNCVVYNIKKNALGEVMVYGNPLNDEVQKRVVINFKQDLDFLHLKGISGSCLSIEKEIKFKIEFFDTHCLDSIDKDHLYNNYEYICISKKDIRESFVPHEYYSPLFNKGNWYFYYSVI